LICGKKPPSTPVALVESATLPQEHRSLTTLQALAATPLPRAEGPVVVCVGEVFRDAALDLRLEFPATETQNEHQRQVHR
jgi:siroheme synthase